MADIDILIERWQAGDERAAQALYDLLNEICCQGLQPGLRLCQLCPLPDYPCHALE